MDTKFGVIVIYPILALFTAYMYVLYSFFYFLQTNVIEAGADMKRDSEKEWYYGNKDKERLGPYSYEEVRSV